MLLGSDTDALVHDAVLPDLRATNKPDSIREIVAKLTAVGAIQREHQEAIVQSILEREDLGSTGIGNGLAVPHAKHASIKRWIGAMALSKDGVEFDSLDGRPVQTIFLFVSPIDRPADHLRELERISRHLLAQ